MHQRKPDPGFCYARFTTQPGFLTAILAGSLLLVTGCPQGSSDGTITGTPCPSANSKTSRSDSSVAAAVDATTGFGSSTAIVLDASGNARLQGTLANGLDLDVYSLGPAAAGDKITVDVTAQDTSGLDSEVAIFDADGNLVYTNDDRNVDANDLDPYIEFIFRHDSTNYFIGITASAFASSTDRSGSYVMTIEVQRNQPVPATAAQIIALDTDGGSALISGNQYTIGPFNTADINSAYTGMTDQVIDQIVATVQENYAQFQLQVLVTSRDQVPNNCTVSRVLLGGSSASAYGLSQKIDSYNEDHCDACIVFTNMFTPDRFGRVLSASELGLAIGNIAAHEVGHLLGLNHVDDVCDIMDTTGGADTFLYDQEFETSPLDDTIFPIGNQDGVLLLAETLGLIQ